MTSPSDAQPPTWDLDDLLRIPRAELLEQITQAVQDFTARWVRPELDLTRPAVLAQALDDYEYLQGLAGWEPGQPTALTRFDFWVRLRQRSGLDQPEDAAMGLGQEAKSLLAATESFWRRIGGFDATTQSRLLAAPELERHRGWLRYRFRAAAATPPAVAMGRFEAVYPGGLAAITEPLERRLGRARARVPLGLDGQAMLMPYGALSSDQDPDDLIHTSAGRLRILQRHRRQGAATLDTAIAYHQQWARLQGLSGPEAAFTARVRGNGFDPERIRAVLTVLRGQFPLVHRYFGLRARLLGRQPLPLRLRSMALRSTPSGYGFGRMLQLVQQAYATVHPYLAELLEEAVNQGRVDAAVRRGKQATAWGGCDLQTLPPYLLYTHTGALFDAANLGHEGGHYLHCRLMAEACSALTFGTCSPLIEACGVLMEETTMEVLAADPELDPPARLAVLMEWLDSTLANLYRQTAGTFLELELHQQHFETGVLDAAQISRLYAGHMRALCGTAVSIEAPERNGWVGWPHFQWGFQMYSYPIAAITALTLRAQLAQDPGFGQEILRFMRTGLRQPEMELLASMGVDLQSDTLLMNVGQVISDRLDMAEALAHDLGQL